MTTAALTKDVAKNITEGISKTSATAKTTPAKTRFILTLS